jgi:hypothetical protein
MAGILYWRREIDTSLANFIENDIRPAARTLLPLDF